MREELRLVRIVAPHFVAGFETDGIVRRAAPIIGYMVGWSDARARAYIAKRGWQATVVPELGHCKGVSQNPIGKPFWETVLMVWETIEIVETRTKALLSRK